MEERRIMEERGMPHIPSLIMIGFIATFFTLVTILLTVVGWVLLVCS